MATAPYKSLFAPSELDRLAERIADRIAKKIKAEISNTNDEILNVEQTAALVQRSKKYVYRHKVELGAWTAPGSSLLRFSKNHVILAMKGGYV